MAEDNSGMLHFFLISIDSENDDNRSATKIGFGAGTFGLASNAPYMGAFSNIPDRVGSAPAVDLSVVIFE